MAEELLPTKRIVELPPAGTLNDADVLPLSKPIGDDAFETKSGTLAGLRSMLNFNLAFDSKEQALTSTNDGQIFHVWTSPEKMVVDEYLNQKGVAIATGESYPSNNMLKAASQDATETKVRTRGLLTFLKSKMPFELLTMKGFRLFAVDNDNTKWLPGKSVSDFLDVIRALSVGSSSLMKARPGSLFELTVGNYRVLRLRDDGAGTVDLRGIPLETHIGLLENTFGGFGDSLTDNGRNPADAGKPRGWTFNARSWQVWASMFSGGRLKYIGQWATGGYTTSDMIRDHLKPAIAARPRFITFLGCRNDVIQKDSAGNFRFSVDTIKSNIRYILTQFRKHGIIPVVCSMAAQNNDDPVLKDRENSINAFLWAFAFDQGFPFVDMRAVTVDPVTDGWRAGYNGKLPNGQPDPSHPVSLGSFHMGKALADTVAPYTMPVYPQLAISNPTTPGGANGVINPLFLDTSNGRPVGWTVESGNVAITSDPAVVGNVMAVTGVGTTIARVSQVVPVAAGERRTFSFMVKTSVDGDNSTACYCEANDANKTNLAGIRSWNFSTGDYLTFSYDFVVPAGVTEVKIIVAANVAEIHIGQAGLIKQEIIE
ncbi:hypothetical protein ALQ63_02883 [Serratia plymuthica]|uniref:SGNH/GDSL hydrolase family protein n=1 Tax=Serratia plymuthica TaxID=82996 RepID=UPI000F00895A|nr:GDSL-type esterase/lipase family protein [Serratia plymuthica]RMN18612.1 hypothetical protein ALQ63_02883 [Serratia plymuthica]